MLKENLRQQLRQSCSEQELRQWFDPLLLNLSQEEKRLRVLFPHPFFAEWFASNLQNKFEEELHQLLGPGYLLVYRNSANTNGGQPTHSGGNGAKTLDYPFGSQFTFETFFANRKNYFSLASAREVAKQTNSQYNPFIICGGNGSGKTHILKSIANEMAKNTPKEHIFFGTMDDMQALYAERFNNDSFATRRFFSLYRAFFLDDLQHIERYPKLQDELVILFNTFYDQKKQMVFAATGQINNFPFLEPKLKSRLEWGLIIHLREPDLDIRIKYVQHMVKAKSIALSKEQVLTLAHRYQDFRFLQGVLLKLSAFRELMHKDLQDGDFDMVLQNTEERTTPSLEPEAILQVVGEHFQTPVKHITGVKRHQKVVLARQLAMYLCRELLGSSYPVLGRIFGGKDHSTAMHSVKKIEKLKRDNEDMNLLLTELRRKCLSMSKG